MGHHIQTRIVTDHHPGIGPTATDVTSEMRHKGNVPRVGGMGGDGMAHAPSRREQQSIESGMDKTDVHHIPDSHERLRGRAANKLRPDVVAVHWCPFRQPGRGIENPVHAAGANNLRITL